MTLIIGKSSNLSKKIANTLINSHLVSVRDFLSNENLLDQYKREKINIIFNNFQTATELNSLESPSQYIAQSIYATALILEKIKDFNINKIIYTSSSSVYGNNKLCAEDDVLMPLSLHASLKAANERLIEKFCSDKGFDYTIVRLFNMFGGDDKFSVISKIIRAFKEKGEITVINNGESIRDYIYIEDVVTVYQKLLDIKKLPIVNMGSGERTSLKDILEYLKKHNLYVETKSLSRNEINISIADSRLLREKVGDLEFKKVHEYMLEEIKV